MINKFNTLNSSNKHPNINKKHSMTIKMENLRCEIVKLERFSSSKSCLASIKLPSPSPVPRLLYKDSPIFSSPNPFLLASLPSYIYPLVTAQRNIFLFMQCQYPPPASTVVLSIAPTSSLPSLPLIPSVCPEQLAHQLFFRHLQAPLAAKEWLISEWLEKIIKIIENNPFYLKGLQICHSSVEFMSARNTNTRVKIKCEIKV